MGVAVSSWQLARAVSLHGQLGVVSGTGIDTVLTRRLQMGDVGGHMRRAFERFPIPEIAEKVWERYFIPGGKAPDQPFKSKPVPTLRPSRALNDLIVLANFVEVFLAKELHDGKVGINLLEKIQLPNLPSLLGAMMARVDYVIMGAGIPRAIPGILDRFAEGRVAEMEIAVTECDGEPGPPAKVTLDPKQYDVHDAHRPKFLAVVSSALLGHVLAKKCDPPVDGFVIEGPTAGGHNAPPRGEVRLNDRGEPIYGEKDIPDLEKFRSLGLPFWLAGSYAGQLREALAAGAAGIQVGTAFAFCEESGIRDDVRRRVIADSLARRLSVRTDPKASPTGFPFKVVEESGTMAAADVYKKRQRICDLGYLREAYRKPDGSFGYRCAAEPVEDYLDKGGQSDQTAGRMCVCNGLLATAGFPQVRHGDAELPLITAGDDVVNVSQYLRAGRNSYTAADVLERLLDGVVAKPEPELVSQAQ